MVPYIICFAITVFFAMLNESLLKTKNRSLIWFTGIMVVLVPAILAGCRDYEIGTDVLVYAKRGFEQVGGLNSFSEFQRYASGQWASQAEIGYWFLAFVVSRFTGDPHWFLFAISLFINIFIYLSLFRLRENCSIWIGELIYLFVCYNETYNMMRQCMALSVVILGLTFLIEDKYAKYITSIVAAYFFHRSAIIALVYLPMYLLMRGQTKEYLKLYEYKIATEEPTGKKIKKAKGNRQVKSVSKVRFWLRLCLISVGAVVAVISFETVSNLLISVGILTTKYSKFVSGNEGNVLWLNALSVYYLMYFFLFSRKDKIKYGYFFFAIAIADIIFYPLKAYMKFLYRVGSYFLYVRVISMSQVKLNLRLLMRGKINKEGAIGLGIIASAIFFWYCFACRWGYNETFPYTSEILGIF